MTPDKLNAHLLEIENGLGGSGELPPYWLEDKLHWHLCKIEELINGGGGGGGAISFVIVDKLPETGEKNVIYFVPKKTIFSKNKYDEYVWIDDEWEYIGTGTIDPTGYATIEYVDTELLKKQDKLEFNLGEVPETAKTLTSIKDGDTVYVIPHSGSTVDWSDVTNKPDFKEVSFTADYEDLINTPTIPADTSDLTNGAGYITESALSGYATEEWVSDQDYITESALSGYATEQWVSDQGYSTFSGSYDDLTDKPTLFSGAYDDLTGKPDLSIYAESADLSTVATTGDYDDLENKPELFSGSYNDLTDKPDLFSGDYEDLTNKPNIPENTSDLNNDSGFITDSALDGYATEDFVTSYHDSTKQDVINDLADIKAGAALGATAVQPAAISDMATKTWVGEQDYLTEVSWGDITGTLSSQTDLATELDKKVETKTFTPTSITARSFDPLDVDIQLSSADCADIFEHKYKLITLVTRNVLQIDLTLTRQADNDHVIGYVTQIDTGEQVYYYSMSLSNSAVYDNLFKRIDNIPLAKVATTGSYNDLIDKPDLFDGDYDSLTNKPDLTVYEEKTNLKECAYLDEDGLEIDYSQLTNTPDIPTKVSDLTNDSGFITGITSSDVTTALGYTPGTSNFSGDYDDLTDKPTFATVATSGSYADLSNTPLSSISISQTTTPGTASRPASTTTTITLDGTDTTINTFTTIDSALSSSSKNPVANDVIHNAISNKVEAEDFQELEKIALTTKGILSGTPLVPVLSITDGVYYPTVSDSGARWKMGKADSPTFYKIYDVSAYTSVHLKSVSRAGHILTNTAPSDFNVHMHQESPTTWYEAADVSDSEQADVLPKTGFTPYDKDLTTNGKHYLIVYEVNAAQAIEVINGGGYSPIYTSMFVNDGDGTTQNDPYAKISDITTPTFTATTFNPDSAITFSQEDLADMYENQYDIIRVVAEILPNVFFNLSFRKTADTEASGLASVKYDYTTCTNGDTLEEISFQVFKNNDTYSTIPYHLQLQNSPVTDVQTSDGTSIVSNKIATLPSVYAHHIYLKGASDDKTNLYCTLITNFSTAFDLDSFFAYVYNLGATGAISATGTVVYSVVGTSENCRAAAAIKAGSTAEKLILVYHGTGDAGISTIEVGKAGANVDLNTIVDSVIKVI